ncbi:MAG: FeoB-associated Cys-rich membrane protein [Candidatus Alectryocaccobium sp.]
MNVWDVVICIILVIVFVAAILLCIKRSKNGCCGNCSKCGGQCSNGEKRRRDR